MTRTHRHPWLAAAVLSLPLAACGPAKENESANAGGGAPAASEPAAASYEWVVQAREAEAADPASTGAALAKGGKGAIPVLIWQLTDSDTPVAMKAADALAALGADAVPALDRVVRSKAANGRNWAIWALGKIGPAAKSAAPGIREAGKDPSFRQVAAESLSKIEK